MSEELLEYILKGFPGTRYYPRFKLTTWHPQGVLDAALADKIITFIEWEEYATIGPQFHALSIGYCEDRDHGLSANRDRGSRGRVAV